MLGGGGGQGGGMLPFLQVRWEIIQPDHSVLQTLEFLEVKAQMKLLV